jgi:hypothetical protein
VSGCDDVWTHSWAPRVGFHFRGVVELGILDRRDSRGRDVAAVIVLPGNIWPDDIEAEGAEVAQRDG